MARVRVATPNLEQDHKRWEARRELKVEQLGALEPDVVALNEVCVPLETARWLQKLVARIVVGGELVDRCIDYIGVSET